jgi:hypothetical protein
MTDLEEDLLTAVRRVNAAQELLDARQEDVMAAQDLVDKARMELSTANRIRRECEAQYLESVKVDA